MIDPSEIREIASETGLNPYVVEKDYVIGWVLAGIYMHPEICEGWVFKGGTCLKKCFFETYRFSEDLDFTLRNAEHLDEAFLFRVLSEVADWVYQNAGINIPIDELRSEVYTNKAGVTAGQARVYFRNPLPHTRSSPGRIKVDLTAYEVLVRDPVQREGVWLTINVIIVYTAHCHQPLTGVVAHENHRRQPSKRNRSPPDRHRHQRFYAGRGRTHPGRCE